MMCEQCRDDFLTVYRNEIKRGNHICYITAHPNLLCLHMDRVMKKYRLSHMQYSESVDCHYPPDKRYFCPDCKTVIASPLKKDQRDRYAISARHIITPEEMSAWIASGELKVENGAIFQYNVINPKVIATDKDLIFVRGWEEYLYWDQDWQVIPTVGEGEKQDNLSAASAL